MTRYAVTIDIAAERDVDDIATRAAGRDSIEAALDVASQIERAIASLPSSPNRGVHPKELLDQGNRAFREIRLESYRIIYRVLADTVVVVLIADGRRDMRALLARRLLGA